MLFKRYTTVLYHLIRLSESIHNNRIKILPQTLKKDFKLYLNYSSTIFLYARGNIYSAQITASSYFKTTKFNHYEA